MFFIVIFAVVAVAAATGSLLLAFKRASSDVWVEIDLLFWVATTLSVVFLLAKAGLMDKKVGKNNVFCCK